MNYFSVTWMMYVALSCIFYNLAIAGEAKPIETKPIKRFALITSANDGGRDRVKLRFADNDAASFAHVLEKLGGIEENDVFVLKEMSATRLDESIENLRQRLGIFSSNNYRTEVMFYFSGHSSEKGLLLAGNTYEYDKLKSKITGLSADVKVIILDSCASGSLTLTKGGTKMPAFLVDASTKTKGHAIITSSSSDEVAQESSRIKGSFFTHHLISALRGSGDSNGDQKISLGEAYQYAYLETLSETQKSQQGAQHPSYDFHLAGTGELVLTDLRSSASLITFSKDLEGQYYISNSNRELVAEIKKIKGKPISFGVDPGKYVLIRAIDGGYQEASFELKENDRLDVTQLQYSMLEGEPTVARGSASSYKKVSSSFQLIPDIDKLKSHENDEEHKFSFGLLGGHSGKIDGMSFGLLGYVVEQGGASGLMLAAGVNFNHGSLYGAQIAGGANYSGSTVTGAQIAAGGNIAGDTVKGAQLSYVNLAFKDMTGAQVGVVNYAKTIDGAQVGVMNVAESTYGLQVGLFNYSKKVNGFQLGLATVANETSGYSFGLINYAGNGTLAVDFTYNELSYTSASLRMGSRYLYTIYDVGVRGFKSADTRSVCGLGVGLTIPFDAMFVGIDLINYFKASSGMRVGRGSTNDAEDNDEESKKEDERFEESRFEKIQLTGGYRLEKLAFFAGISFGLFNKDKETFKENFAPDYRGAMTSNNNHTTWLGYVAGIRYNVKSR